MPKRGTGWRKRNTWVGGDVYRPRPQPTPKQGLPSDQIGTAMIGNRQYGVCCDGSLRRA